MTTLSRRGLATRVTEWHASPGLAAVLLLATAAVWPLLTRSSLPTFTDAQYHVYRTYEVLSAWRQGIPYLRWAPDFYYGFGYPLFNYYAPLTYYLAAPYGWFLGPVAGVKFVLVLSAYLGTAGIFMLSRDTWGTAGGVVSSAAYAFAPYLVFTDPVQRGAVPECLALALAPWVLWSFTRLARVGARRYFVAAALSLAALLLAHNLISVVVAALTAGWLAFDQLAVDRRASRPDRFRGLALLAAAGLIGAGLAAFMWLPAVLERDAVQYHSAFVGSLANRFVPAGELFAPASAADARGLNIWEFTFRLGLPQWALALLGALTLLRAGSHRRPVSFFALAAGALLALMLPQALPVWDQARFLYYLQFAYRLMGPAALCLAWLAGGATRWVVLLKGRATANTLAVVCAVACALGALPLLNPLPWPEFGPVTPQAIVDLELTGRWGIGTTAGVEFLPVDVRAVPRPDQAMLAALAEGTVDKIDDSQLPPGTTVLSRSHGALHDRFDVTAPRDFALRVLTFYWPGWTAYVDGRRTPIAVTDPEGLISVPVPAGQHDVLVRLEDTWPRRLGWGISAGALLILAGLVFSLRRPASPGLALPADDLSRRASLALAGFLLAVLSARAGLDAWALWRAAHAWAPALGAQEQRHARFENNLGLIAYDLPLGPSRPGDDVLLTLYWQTLGRVPLNLSSYVHFFGPDGQLVAQSDHLDAVEYHPTTRWPMATAMRDEHHVRLPLDAPPGRYRVGVGLWYRPTGVRSRVLDQAGRPTEIDTLTLTTEFGVSP